MNPAVTRKLSHGAGRFLVGASFAIILLGASPDAPTEAVDLLIKGGTVFTGDVGPGVVADVAIRGDRIVLVGDSGKVRASRVIDAAGMVVAPGFVDPHAHTDGDLFSDDPKRRASLSNLAQGVTTNVLGVDGAGAPDTAALFARAIKAGPGVNFATYVGFGSIRREVLGMQDRAPDATELERMQALVAKGMCGGAIGFSTGLFYAPQSYAKTEEVIALAREAAVRGGHYDSHQRDEGNGGAGSIGITASVAELIRVAREAGLPGHFAHLKNSGVRSWGESAKVIALIDQARAAGVRVTADQYPYLGSGGSVTSILIPRWAQVGGREETLRRFADPAVAPRLKAEMADFLDARGGPRNLLVTQRKSPWVGKTLADLAREWSVEPIDAAVRVYREGDPGMAIFAIGEDDLRAYLVQPWVMTGSDASDSHPRKFGAFAATYDTYVVKEKRLSIAQFVHRSTMLPAETFRIVKRGQLRSGYFADVVVFDPKTYRPQSTYVRPELPAIGVQTVIVNGRVAFKAGAPTGVLAGRGLAQTPPPGSCG